MTDRNKIHAKLREDILITRVDNALCQSLLSYAAIGQLHAAIDAYLNTRPEAPRWLLSLSDALNENEVPARRKAEA